MIYFAQLNENNIVIDCVVVDNSVAIDEATGVAFLRSTHGSELNWKQTYKDGTRKNFAGKGYTFDSGRNAFLTPKIYPSWILDENTCKWEPPTPYPDDDKKYKWDEDTTSWVEIE